MIKVAKNYKKGTLILEEIKFDHVFKKKVMASDKVGKIYLPKDLVGKMVYVIVDMNGLNGIEDVQEDNGKGVG